jgi:hypothetical protein
MWYSSILAMKYLDHWQRPLSALFRGAVPNGSICGQWFMAATGGGNAGFRSGSVRTPMMDIGRVRMGVHKDSQHAGQPGVFATVSALASQPARPRAGTRMACSTAARSTLPTGG